MQQTRESANGMPALLTAREVALALRLSPSAIYRAVQQGELQSVRLTRAGSIRVPASELDRLLGGVREVAT